MGGGEGKTGVGPGPPGGGGGGGLSGHEAGVGGTSRTAVPGFNRDLRVTPGAVSKLKSTIC